MLLLGHYRQGFLDISALTDPTDDLSPTTRNAKLNKHEGLDWALATLSTPERARRLGSARACSAGFVKFDSLVVPNQDRGGSFTVRFTVVFTLSCLLVLPSISPPPLGQFIILTFVLCSARLVSLPSRNWRPGLLHGPLPHSDLCQVCVSLCVLWLSSVLFPAQLSLFSLLVRFFFSALGWLRCVLYSVSSP